MTFNGLFNKYIHKILNYRKIEDEHNGNVIMSQFSLIMSACLGKCVEICFEDGVNMFLLICGTNIPGSKAYQEHEIYYIQTQPSTNLLNFHLASNEKVSFWLSVNCDRPHEFVRGLEEPHSITDELQNLACINSGAVLVQKL